MSTSHSETPASGLSPAAANPPAEVIRPSEAVPPTDAAPPREAVPPADAYLVGQETPDVQTSTVIPESPAGLGASTGPGGPLAAAPSAPAAAPAGRGRWHLLPTMTGWLALGLGLVVVISLFGAIGPFFAGDPDAINDIGLAGPSGANLLGTTQTGQDVLSQLSYATRGSLQIGLLVGVMATVLSAFFGIYGAYLGGFTDEAFSLLSNVFLVIPGLPLVIVISGFVPPEDRGLWTIAVVLALTSWAASARVLRAQTLSVRNRDYVAASQLAGERPWRVIAVEILPNLLPVLASQFVYAVIAAILGEAGLSFLGLGASNASTLGTMLFYAQNGFALPLGAWWWFVPPGLIIALFGMGLSLINFSIDEIIDPKLKNTRTARRRLRRAGAAARKEAS